MTADATSNDLARTLDRIAREEQRTAELEAMLKGQAPTRPAGPSDPTPPLIPWPAAREWRRPDPAVRVGELEAKLADAERRAAEAEAKLAAPREAPRLELAGRLLVGVAHDFNNLLTVVTGHAELIRDRLQPTDPMWESADAIAATGNTAAQIARQLLAFAKPSGSACACPFDPNRAVTGIERILRRLAHRVKVDVLLTPGLPSIRLDPGQFDQVVLNLVANSRDAITNTGTITVRTALATVAADRPGWPAECPPGEYVALTVSDTGCGMTDEVKAKAFERFFTTKGANGTGLGLATVRDIVCGAGGHVEVESSPGWGTSVRVFWPAVGRSGDGSPVLRVHDS
jgi:signal transduction histidine kinase